jgi:hypothetical protein
MKAATIVRYGSRSVILSVRGLWSPRRGQPPVVQQPEHGSRQAARQ